MKTKEQLLLSVILAAFLTSFVLWLSVWIGGQTFGQRAAEKYEWGTPQWESEVQRLVDGEEECENTMIIK